MVLPQIPAPAKRPLGACLQVPSAAATPLEWNLNFAEHAEARASAFSARGALLFRAAGGAMGKPACDGGRTLQWLQWFLRVP